MASLVGFGQEGIPLADAHGERQGAGLKGNRGKRYGVKVWSFHGVSLRSLETFLCLKSRLVSLKGYETTSLESLITRFQDLPPGLAHHPETIVQQGFASI